MEALTPLLNFLKDRPDLFVTAFILFNWWLERNERRTQQDINSDLQKKMLEQVGETKTALIEIRSLLNILTRGRHS
jgi:hypothetical protein